jgi:hypothetical protein
VVMSLVLLCFDLAPPGAIWYHFCTSGTSGDTVLISLPPEQFGIMQFDILRKDKGF